LNRFLINDIKKEPNSIRVILTSGRNYLLRRKIMKREKSEEKNEVVVLDSGIDTAAAENPFMACCSGPFMTVWWR
jgi:predicted AAA+ superfamily ATPase